MTVTQEKLKSQEKTNNRKEDQLSGEETKSLIRAALEKLSSSYAPYSHFHVASALLCSDGTVYTGVNIENASYSATNCAERTAFFKAVSEGKKEFRAMAICGGKDGKPEGYCTPCGICRQVMREFCSPDCFQIVVAGSEEDYRIFTLEQLLPESFGPENLM